MHRMRRPSFFFLVMMVHSCLAGLTTTVVAAQTNNVTADQSALVALKAHVTSDPKNMLTNWSSATSVCNWVGVTCGAPNLRVEVLNISYFGLKGSIPPELGNLSFLAQLDFTNNRFHGTFPVELSRLRRLKSLSFGYNDFEGSLPTEIFNLLSALEKIDLTYNHLSGSIPKEIGNLTMLKELILDGNNFKEIPNEVGRLDKLEVLNVEDNTLTGPVPVAVFNMSSLVHLGITNNNLTGGLPDNICEHLPSIQAFYMSYNQFDGPLPSKLWQCKELLQLKLAFNEFSGGIPKNIGNLTSLTHLYLAANNLEGTIPSEIGDLARLQILSLPGVNVHGVIPSTIFNMSSIVGISLASNQLSGSLPANIGLGVPNLKQLLVSGNNLTGAIPKFIANASNIVTIDMAANSFSGFVPSSLCALQNLERLNLAQNNLTIDTSTPEVNFLSCLVNLQNLDTLLLSRNPLNAMLPVSFGNLSSSLQYIDLSISNIRGNIPIDIGNLSSLVGLFLGTNQVSGSIPTSIGTLQNLQALNLKENRLQGHIPNQLCQLQNLAFLLVGVNQFSGSIPSCMGNLAASLRSLYLGSNLLTFTIPFTLWELKYLLHIDLSSNFLTGPLPEDIGALKVLIDIDLSNNRLSGRLPSSIGGLQDLVTLALENNSLEGPIPSSFGNLLSLEILDLSKNNLSGVIPKSLEKDLHLNHLNLSFNKLEGEIPAGGPFKKFSSESFESNGALCGEARFDVPSCQNISVKSSSTKASRSILKFIIPGILSVILLVASISMLILRRKRNVNVATETTSLSQPLWRKVSYIQLLRTTDGFSVSNLLGTGGFGSVYKGTLDGMNVAIKVFNLQLEETFKSFHTECEMLSSIRHRNLIRIISCCSQTDFKAVVLNYMPNGSLDKWLYSQSLSLNILQRLNIMTDVASALEYLHYGYGTPIVHCDLKPSNILLDEDMVAHVADFGISKLLGGGETMTQTMTLATIGYMAPEYGTEGIVSRRGDVYSFGIVVMETFTKQKPTDEMLVGEMGLKRWVESSLSSPDAIVEVVDANLLGKEDDVSFVNKKACLSSIMKVALACCAESPEERINIQAALVTLKKIKAKLLEETAAGAGAGGVL